MKGTDLIAQLDKRINNDNKRTNYLIKYHIFEHLKHKHDTTLPPKLTAQDIAQIKESCKASPYLQEKIEKNVLTDAMFNVQLEEIKKAEVDKKVEKLNEHSLRVRVNLFGLDKTAESEELEGVRYEKNQSRAMKGINTMINRVPGYARTPLSIALKVGA